METLQIFLILVIPANYSGVGNDPGSPSQVRIYPNPASEYLSIITKEFTVIEATILDLAGKTVKTYYTGFERLNIADLPSGTYLIRLTGKQTIISGLFIKR
jgi:hypothetical protein